MLCFNSLLCKGWEVRISVLHMIMRLTWNHMLEKLLKMLKKKKKCNIFCLWCRGGKNEQKQKKGFWLLNKEEMVFPRDELPDWLSNGLSQRWAPWLVIQWPLPEISPLIGYPMQSGQFWNYLHASNKSGLRMLYLYVCVSLHIYLYITYVNIYSKI